MSRVDIRVRPSDEGLGIPMAADHASRGNARLEDEDPLGACRGIGLALLIGALIWGGVFLVARFILF